MSQVQNGTKEMLPDKRTYTVEEVPTERRAFQSYISGYRQNLRIHIKEGHFKIVRIGNAIRISKRSFDEWPRHRASDS